MSNEFVHLPEEDGNYIPSDGMQSQTESKCIAIFRNENPSIIIEKSTGNIDIRAENNSSFIEIDAVKRDLRVENKSFVSAFEGQKANERTLEKLKKNIEQLIEQNQENVEKIMFLEGKLTEAKREIEDNKIQTKHFSATRTIGIARYLSLNPRKTHTENLKLPSIIDLDLVYTNKKPISLTMKICIKNYRGVEKLNFANISGHQFYGPVCLKEFNLPKFSPNSSSEGILMQGENNRLFLGGGMDDEILINNKTLKRTFFY